MDRFERIYALHRLLSARRTPISADDIAEALRWSRATVYRVVRELRDYLGAPIPEERGAGIYYDRSEGRFELPGLWFSAAEIRALLVFRALLHNLGPGLLDSELEPLRERIEKILAGRPAGAGELERRVRILRIAGRDPGSHFQASASALVERRRLHIVYLGRARNRETARDISPQRLTHYRDCWYLDAWCHRAQALRSFAIERIRRLETLDEPAQEIADAELDRHFADAYGIFAGPAKHTAILRFTPERARWVADEAWHPEQHGQFLADGSYELHVPYGDPTELVMDILKYGPGVEVVRPVALRAQVRQMLADALEQYRSAEASA